MISELPWSISRLIPLSLLLFLQSASIVHSKVFPIRSDVPSEWIVADLLLEKLCTEQERLEEVLSKPGSADVNGLFAISPSEPFCLISNGSLRHWDPAGRSQLFLVDVLVTRGPNFKRVVIVQVEIQSAESTNRRIVSNEYLATVNSSVAPNRTELRLLSTPENTTVKQIVFVAPKITLLGTNAEEIKEVDFLPITKRSVDYLRIFNAGKNGSEHYATVFLRKPLNNEDEQLFFYLAAVDRPSGRRLATTRIRIREDRPPKPQFDRDHILLNFDSPIQPHKTIVRVTAKTSHGAAMYRIEPESAPFDVAPIIGDVFAKRDLPNGRYSFRVLAMDSSGQDGECTVEIRLERNTTSAIGSVNKTVHEASTINPQMKNLLSNHGDKDRRRQFSPRSEGKRRLSRKLHNRRDPQVQADDLALVLSEDQPLGMLNEIFLHPSEHIRPLSDDGHRSPIFVHENGSLELIRELNFEVEQGFRVVTQIVGPLRTRLQTILVEVADVDEPPTILNQPRPFFAVVSSSDHQPLWTEVYRVEARDEFGYGSDNVTYHMISSDPPGAFIVDQMSGSIRTVLNKYVAGQLYRVFVEARDHPASDGAINVKPLTRNSVIAIVEILAADRPPQFFRPKYHTSIAENLEIGSGVIQLEAHQFPLVNGYNSVRRPIVYQLSTSSGTSFEHDFSNHFGIYEHTGLIFIRKKIDYDDRLQPKTIRLIGIAKNEGRESTVPIEVEILDVNDNAPTFVQPLYTASVREDITSETPILKVKAFDVDSGINSAIVYSVDHPQFTVNSLGEISLCEGCPLLDADQNRQGFFIYRFNVSATDQGNPPLSSSALVHIRAENINDEAPIFVPGPEYTAFIAEDAQGATPVVQVHAIDPDRDQVFYSFAVGDGGAESQITQIFEIDRDTGLIRLRSRIRPQDLSDYDTPYNLTVLARDDGSCCDHTSTASHSWFLGGSSADGHKSWHTSRAHVRIEIADVNNNKPEFVDCTDYSRQARIEEGQYKAADAPIIIRVHATDDDAGQNGQVQYSVYYSRSEQRKPFVIDPHTGDLRPSPYFVFDREQKAFEEVTIKATDKGDHPLIGFCQFTVQVMDVNDNTPQFDRLLYETTIARSIQIGDSVLTVHADDRDSPPNARITYVLASDETAQEPNKDDVKYFEVNPESGEITLVREVPRDKARFQFSVVANDNGWPEPQMVVVQAVIRVHDRQQNAPQWQNNPVECPQQVIVSEDIQKNTVILKCFAMSGEDRSRPISYKLSNSANNFDKNNKQTFREFVEKNDAGFAYVIVRNMESLDYEQVHNYTLVLTATDIISSVTSERNFQLIVSDRNDEVPRFTVDRFIGTIDEEMTPAEYADRVAQPITVVHAEDADSPGKQSEIRYRIIDGQGWKASTYFRIDEISGEIYPLEKFDRERNDSFIFDVEARDSMPSSLPGTRRGEPNKDIVNVQVFVADLNDNPPRFDSSIYEVRIPEDVEIGKVVLTVKATDLDSHSNLRYYLYSPGSKATKIPFGVKTDSGAIYVKDVLDYEDTNVYYLELMSSDGKHNTTTGIRLFIEDVNDNPPVFEQHTYETVVIEENQDLPKFLFRVHATDRDKSENNGNIVYKLEGHRVEEHFRVDRHSGELQLIAPLDRDPPNGMSEWKFIVQAIDGGGFVGYADVHVVVRDINDNSPVFPSQISGEVDENRDPESFVMTVEAMDLDDPATPNAQLEYSIGLNKEINGQPIFRIDPTSGKIFATVKFDRELVSERQFQIQVRATDHGIPQREGFGNVTIRVADLNDNPPYFERADYFLAVPESAPLHSSILTLLARDEDNEAKNNEFTYEIVGELDNHFYITTEENQNGKDGRIGVLRIKNHANQQQRSDEVM